MIEYVTRSRSDFINNISLIVPHEDDPKVPPPPKGSKPPGNLSADQIADAEVSFVGNIADFCIAMGSIPPVKMGCFFRSETGEVKGLRPASVVEDGYSERYPGLEHVISHLRAYAGEVVSTEGVGVLLTAGEHTRAWSRYYYDKPNKDYVTIKEAASEVGVVPRTIYRWIENSWIECIQDMYGEVIVEIGSVRGAAIAVPIGKSFKARNAS